MSEFEQRLRRGLTSRAASVAPSGDLDDLVERIATQRSRGRRASAFAMALIVVVGPIGGFALARATDGTTANAASKTGAKHVKTTKSTFSPTPMPVLPSGSPAASNGTQVLNGVNGINGCTATMFCVLQPPEEALSLGRMFARTTGDGVNLRVYGAQLPAQTETVPWFTPAPWCFPNRLVQVDASNALIAGNAQAYLYEQPRDGLGASVAYVGESEGAPVWVAVVQSTKGTTARATFADGGSDLMTLNDGTAVLSHAVADGTDAKTLPQQKLHVEVLDASGATVSDITVTAQGSGLGEAATSDPADCSTPAKLPAPGPEQPSDVAAATAGVTQAFTDVYTGRNSDAVKDAAIDDLTGVDAARSELRSGSYADEVNVATAHVSGVVFLSATKAAVAYDIDIPGYTNFTGRLGEADFSGGRWKVTRGTFCNDIAMAGVTCSP